MSVNRIDLAWINTTNLTASKKFFTDVLGMQVLSETPEHNWIELIGKGGGTVLGLGSGDESPIKAGANAVVCLTVSDIEAMKKRLQEHNVILVGDIQEIPGHVKMLLFKDPDGNLFHLAQNLS